MDEATRKKYQAMKPVVTVLMQDGGDLADYDDLKSWEGVEVARELSEMVVDADLEVFSKVMESLGNDGLARPERAIIKTYLAWKLGLGQEQKENA